MLAIAKHNTRVCDKSPDMLRSTQTLNTKDKVPTDSESTINNRAETFQSDILVAVSWLRLEMPT